MPITAATSEAERRNDEGKVVMGREEFRGTASDPGLRTRKHFASSLSPLASSQSKVLRIFTSEAAIEADRTAMSRSVFICLSSSVRRVEKRDSLVVITPTTSLVSMSTTSFGVGSSEETRDKYEEMDSVALYTSFSWREKREEIRRRDNQGKSFYVMELCGEVCDLCS